MFSVPNSMKFSSGNLSPFLVRYCSVGNREDSVREYMSIRGANRRFIGFSDRLSAYRPSLRPFEGERAELGV